ncbi:MAG: ADP-ribosylglycohydrolase family protein, partial [Deltaproteobacteria bacterium]|nr:ADP-ribosylglycohydrolase family protein [Deltaproteobacteria bacterium]
ESLVSRAKAQTAMTHNNPLVIESADFFSRLTIRILNGAAPVAAINDVVKDVDYTAPFTDWIEQGIVSVKNDTRSAISEFGQMCETPAAFPSVIHLIVKYENNLKEALIENVMAGGDSAARGLLVGMALGAHSGPEAIPPAWLSELKAREKILGFLSNIDRV